MWASDISEISNTYSQIAAGCTELSLSNWRAAAAFGFFGSLAFAAGAYSANAAWRAGPTTAQAESSSSVKAVVV